MLSRIRDYLENLIYNQKLDSFVWSQSKENCGMLYFDYLTKAATLWDMHF